MDGGAWWAAVYGVAQSRTRLKRLSCSSSIAVSGGSSWVSWWELGVFTLTSGPFTNIQILHSKYELLSLFEETNITFLGDILTDGGWMDGWMDGKMDRSLNAQF